MNKNIEAFLHYAAIAAITVAVISGNRFATGLAICLLLIANNIQAKYITKLCTIVYEITEVVNSLIEEK